MDDQEVVGQVKPDHLQDDPAFVLADPQQALVEVTPGWNPLRIAGGLDDRQRMCLTDPVLPGRLG